MHEALDFCSLSCSINDQSGSLTSSSDPKHLWTLLHVYFCRPNNNILSTLAHVNFDGMCVTVLTRWETKTFGYCVPMRQSECHSRISKRLRHLNLKSHDKGTSRKRIRLVRNVRMCGRSKQGLHRLCLLDDVILQHATKIEYECCCLIYSQVQCTIDQKDKKVEDLHNVT
jgi:hypothetical protein